MADDPILSAIEGVHQDIDTLRSDLTRRLDQMVTRREHESEVRRLDAEDRQTREALARHEATAERQLRDMETSIEVGDAKILAAVAAERDARVQEREAQAKAAEIEREQRRSDRRWMVTAAGIIAAIASTIFQLIRAAIS